MRNLTAALISQGSKSSVMTAEAMKKYFGRVDMLQLKNVKVSLGKESGVFYEGKLLDSYDCVYIKGSFRYANLQRSIAFMLEGKVPYMPFPANSFTIVHNKLLTHLILQQHNIPMPKTFISPTTDAAKELLVDAGFNPLFGARPLKRAIQRFLEDPLAMELLSGRFHEGDHILVDVREGILHFST